MNILETLLGGTELWDAVSGLLIRTPEGTWFEIAKRGKCDNFKIMLDNDREDALKNS